MVFLLTVRAGAHRRFLNRQTVSDISPQPGPRLPI